MFHVEAGPMLALRTKGYDEFKIPWLMKMT